MSVKILHNGIILNEEEIIMEQANKKRQYVSDSVCMVALQGLRYVSKEDTNWSNKTDYNLEVSYKGLTKRFQYGTEKKLRDDMFDSISSALDKRA